MWLMLVIVLAVIGSSIWYWQTRTTEAFAVTTVAWAGLALLLVKTLFVLLFVGLIAGIIYTYMNKPEIIEQAKDKVDEIISKVKDHI